MTRLRIKESQGGLFVSENPLIISRLRAKYRNVRHVVKIPRSPSLAKGIASKAAPISSALADGTGPTMVTFVSVVTPVLGEIAKVIPRLLDEFMKAITEGVEEGLKEIASTKVLTR